MSLTVATICQGLAIMLIPLIGLGSNQGLFSLMIIPPRPYISTQQKDTRAAFMLFWAAFVSHLSMTGTTHVNSSPAQRWKISGYLVLFHLNLKRISELRIRQYPHQSVLRVTTQNVWVYADVIRIEMGLKWRIEWV